MNPFEAPADPIVEPDVLSPGGAVLATRGARIAASLIDVLVQLPIVLPIQYFMGVYDNFPRVREFSTAQKLVWGALGFALTLAVHGYFLAKSAQSIGKRMVGIQIVNASDDRPAPFGRIVLWRLLPISLANALPYVGQVAILGDVLLIFRKDRRCVHDHIAGTRVVVKPLKE